MLHPRSSIMHPNLTTKRCLGHVATVFIAPNGGRPNIVAKSIATLWYLLILPDAQARFHRQLYRKRLPWYAPQRVFGMLLSASNILTMPFSWALLFAGKRNASRIACFLVLLNPPTITLSSMIVQELATAVIRKACRLVSIAAPSATKQKPALPKSSATSSKTVSNNAATKSSNNDSASVETGP